MKIHQSGDKIIVTELRPMSDLTLGKQSLIFINDYGFISGYKSSNDNDVIGNGHYFNGDQAMGWLPMPIYQPGKSKPK